MKNKIFENTNSMNTTYNTLNEILELATQINAKWETIPFNVRHTIDELFMPEFSVSKGVRIINESTQDALYLFGEVAHNLGQDFDIDELEESKKTNEQIKVEDKVNTDITDITDIVNSFDTVVMSKEELGSNFRYYTTVTSVEDAEKFNYHSDYWGDSAEYQEDNVELMKAIEPFIGKKVTVEDGEEVSSYTVLGIAIDNKYNDVSHTVILGEKYEITNETKKLKENFEPSDDFSWVANIFTQLITVERCFDEIDYYVTDKNGLNRFVAEKIKENYDIDDLIETLMEKSTYLNISTGQEIYDFVEFVNYDQEPDLKNLVYLTDSYGFEDILDEYGIDKNDTEQEN